MIPFGIDVRILAVNEKLNLAVLLITALDLTNTRWVFTLNTTHPANGRPEAKSSSPPASYADFFLVSANHAAALLFNLLTTS